METRVIEAPHSLFGGTFPQHFRAGCRKRLHTLGEA
jgi:hypothetical protein